MAREKGAVHPVERKPGRQRATLVVDPLRELAVACTNAQLATTAPAEHTDTRLAPVAILAAEIEADFVLAQAILGEAQITLDDLEVAPAEVEARRNEPARGRGQRLVQLGEQSRLLPHLEVGLEFPAEPVDIGKQQPDTGIEAAAALEVVLQLEAKAQEVRPPTGRAGGDLDASDIIGTDQLIVHGLKVAVAVEARHAARRSAGIQRLADGRRQRRLDQGRVALRGGIGAHEADDGRSLRPAAAQLGETLPCRLLQRQGRQPR